MPSRKVKFCDAVIRYGDTWKKSRGQSRSIMSEFMVIELIKKDGAPTVVYKKKGQRAWLTMAEEDWRKGYIISNPEESENGDGKTEESATEKASEGLPEEVSEARTAKGT